MSNNVVTWVSLGFSLFMFFFLVFSTMDLIEEYKQENLFNDATYDEMIHVETFDESFNKTPEENVTDFDAIAASVGDFNV